jgi:hypothetical protein
VIKATSLRSPRALIVTPVRSYSFQGTSTITTMERTMLESNRYLTTTIILGFGEERMAPKIKKKHLNKLLKIQLIEG